MRIQHNIMAMNAYRNYSTNTSALSKNLEKLSSGYKINRAGDDAAGLAISEKMRAQITGLDKAQDNAQDGISLIQTAEGALTEVHDMLNRMVELATQSANGTYQDEVDRANLNNELIELKGEIDRIAETSNFNGIKLLDGSLNNEFTETDAVNGVDLTVSAGADFGANKVKFAKTATASKAVADITATAVTITLDQTKSYSAADIQAMVREKAKEILAKGTAASGIQNNAKGLLSFTVSGGTVKGSGATATLTLAQDSTANGALKLQIGDTSEPDNVLQLNIQAMNTASLDIDTVKIDTQDSAQAAIDAIKAASDTVSTVRGTLGANQNRLEHTINNLSVMQENIQNAESAIRDTDVADEMMAYTKNNILIQSAQAMLAQANQVPQGVLQLLQ